MTEITKEWFEKRAALEGDSEIGAGVTYVPPFIPSEADKFYSKVVAAYQNVIADKDAEIAKLRDALKPFAAMIERSDAMDVEFLARTAPGIELEIYTPSTDKLVGSGEMRNAVYVTRGDFRRAWAALNGGSDAP